MIKRLPSVLLIPVLSIVTHTAYAYLSPVFDLDRLYEAVPIAAKIIVEETRESEPIFVEKVEGIQWEGAEMLARVATLKVLRVYKGEVPERIELLFPYWVKGTIGTNLMWESVAKGDSVIVFLKKLEGERYRFWYDVYESKIHVTEKTSEEKDSYRAFRADIIQSIADMGPSAIECMRAVSRLGWQDTLPAVQSISRKDGADKVAMALLTRLQMGDRTAYPEALSLFNQPGDWPEDREVNNARYGCLYAFARQGHREAYELLKSIASGTTPGMEEMKAPAGEYLKNVVTPKEILDAGNALVKKETVEGMDVRLAYTVAEAAGRNDWYDKVHQSNHASRAIVPEIKDW